MYKLSDCKWSLDNLEEAALELISKGTDPKEMLDACSYLEIASYSGDKSRHLRRKLVMRAYDLLRVRGCEEFGVYQVLCYHATELFLKEDRIYHAGIAMFALRKMKEKKSKMKHSAIIKEQIKSLMNSRIDRGILATA